VSEALRVLHEGLSSRPMPETVASTLLELNFVSRDATLKRAIEAAAGSRRYSHSSMRDEWFQPVSPRSQITTALNIFADYISANPSPDIISASETNPARIERFIAYLSSSLHKQPLMSDFKNDRMNRMMRHGSHVALGNHAYNKRFRFLGRLEEKNKTYLKETRLLSYRVVGKGGLVDDITLDDFIASPLAAAFVAYYVARKNRRSTFTNQSQSRPFDTVAKTLLDHCFASSDIDWSLIARVYPEAAVLRRLDDHTKGKLLGSWLNMLVSLAGDLETAWRDGNINLDTMIVHRGNDSSTWNLVAQAWNTSRTAWMSMLADTGQQGFLTDCCPGKVMRLMAGDVAFWHRSDGGDVHPDTKVWKALPKPWEVLRGERVCTLAMVKDACTRAGSDPVTTGWIEGRVANVAVKFDPTPELVHGVEVSSPFFALLLRKMGVFSGKKLKLPQEA
jgi:hypothetical protein